MSSLNNNDTNDDSNDSIHDGNSHDVLSICSMPGKNI